MEKITAYYCKHCKKLFRRNKHFCFKDVANKACATCDHYNGTDTIDVSNGLFSVKNTVSLCNYNYEDHIIAEHNYSGKFNVPFKKINGFRGYMCDWWKKRKDIKDEK